MLYQGGFSPGIVGIGQMMHMGVQFQVGMSMILTIRITVSSGGARKSRSLDLTFPDCNVYLAPLALEGQGMHGVEPFAVLLCMWVRLLILNIMSGTRRIMQSDVSIQLWRVSAPTAASRNSSLESGYKSSQEVEH